MIQRVQSIYLFLVVVLMSFMMLSPIAVFDLQDGSILHYLCFGVKKITGDDSQKILSTWPNLLLVLVIAILNLYTIFLFTNRILQMRLTIYNMLLMVGMVVLIYYYYHVITKKFPIISHSLKFAAIIPVICVILNLLAFRGIRRDELLVKSYERLRK